MDLTLKYYCKKCDEQGELSIDVKGNYQFKELEPEPVITIPSCDKCNPVKEQ